MPVDSFLDISPKAKPASDTLDLTDDSDFELDIRVTHISGGILSSVVNLPTTTVNTNGCSADTCLCSATCTCNGDYYTCYGTCTAPGNGC